MPKKVDDKTTVSQGENEDLTRLIKRAITGVVGAVVLGGHIVIAGKIAGNFVTALIKKRHSRLRSEPATVSEQEAQQVFGLRMQDFDWGFGLVPQTYTQHQYHAKGHVVVDYATGLIWQQAGSPKALNYKDAQAYIRTLNKRHVAWHADWRIPTIPELMSLLEPYGRENEHGLDINPVFDSTQRDCWSSDALLQRDNHVKNGWIVSFASGFVLSQYDTAYVRAVRSA